MSSRCDASVALVPEQVGLALLLLVDNSQGLRSVWPDIQDHYLPSLFRHIESLPYPTLQTETLVVESNPGICDSGTIGPRHHRTLRDAVADIRFPSQSNNRLTLNIMKKGLELLASTNAAERHAIILAASAPTSGCNDPLSNLDRSRWVLLAQYLAKERIHCHLMISPHADRSLFTTLFEENLRLQNLIEKQTWPPLDGSKIIIRMSGHRDSATQEHPNNIYRASQPLNSFDPSLPVGSTPITPSPSTPLEPQDPAPSLVAQLQQVHGLTKKKVYGAKPVRKPFVSTEVYRENGRKSVSLSPLSPPDTSHGGRVQSSTLASRSARHHQTVPVVLPQFRCHDGAGASPTNRSPISMSSYPQPISSPTSPVPLADYSISSLNPWMEANRQPSTWGSSPSSIIDSSQGYPSLPDPSENLQSTPTSDDFTRLAISAHSSFIPPSFSGREQPTYAHSSISRPPTSPSESTSTSTSTSPGPSHNDYFNGSYSPQENPMPMARTRSSIPQSVYRDELLSHLEVPSKPLTSVLSGFAQGVDSSSSSTSPTPPTRTPPSALFGPSADVQLNPSHVLPVHSARMDTRRSSISPHTSSPPQGYSRFYSVSPIPSSNLPTSSHWEMLPKSMPTAADIPESFGANTNDPALPVDNVAFGTGESQFHQPPSAGNPTISTRVQLHSSQTAVLSPLTIPSTYSSSELSSLPSSGSSSLTGWAG
ncbi:hypothetical protein D9758_010446 [Tetrapyrgos nigripes]|uniref:Uncharacterized protein n=1 Tax=Tetrapyrgos nigripes TaxID=182062 RepID=A0A8H5CQ57_9AGAR|nr:hypothetical protein D9758_010446 [Tetrapyrgos nigripes]